MSRPLPSRAEVRSRITGLVGGAVTREEVADWAGEWVGDPDPPVDDYAVWEALKMLVSADLKVSPHEYLYGEDDFPVWLDDMESGPVNPAAD